MFEGDGAFPRQPVRGGKDLGPGIVGQQGHEFIQRTRTDPHELLVDGRFERRCVSHIVLLMAKTGVLKHLSFIGA